MGVAVGQMGLSVNEWLNLTPVEFDAVWQAWNTAAENEFKARWEQTRTIAYTIARQNDVKNKIPTPVRFMPFPWDAEKQSKPVTLTREEQEARFRYLAEKWK